MRLFKRFGHLFDLELDPKWAVDNVGHTIEIEQVYRDLNLSSPPAYVNI
jgi:hypothetical protein